MSRARQTFRSGRGGRLSISCDDAEMPWHPLERSALVQALREAGPGRPTLCAGWSTQHLAAHVVLRENAPLLAAGIAVPPLAARTERAVQTLGDLSADPAGYARLLTQLAEGPPRWQPMHWAGDAANLLELFVHTEDVRRGGPAGGDVPARTRTPEHAEALWRGLSRSAGLFLRRAPVPVRLVDDGREIRVATGRQRSAGLGAVTVRGPLDDLVLHAFGRDVAVRVDVQGPPEAVDAYLSGRGSRPPADGP